MSQKNMGLHDAYLNPWDDKKDRGYLSALTDLLSRWYRARNGQQEDIEVAAQWGIDRNTGKSLSLILRTQLRNPAG